uniref:Armadillo repeat-containing domain-containing protein n=1 Tax=Lactuca sativa TaxID=4236 RepID=A0A9R1WTY1_LACSA|nr:hypothetical protein LSAT_V11C900494630 [Lactuca sativa]
MYPRISTRGGIAQDLCTDGCKRLTYRPIFVETGVIVRQSLKQISLALLFICFKMQNLTSKRRLHGLSQMLLLVEAMTKSNPRIVTVFLEGLENILKVSEVEKNLGRSADVNHYAHMVDDAEGLEKIENLQRMITMRFIRKQ